MPTAESIFLVTLAGLALSASPGPSMLYVLSRSIGQSRSAGLASAAGLAAGGFIHVIAAALGLVAVFTYFPSAYTVVKILGGAYLIYLALQMLFDKDEPSAAGEKMPSVRRSSIQRIFYQGIAVEVLNPKTLLFFVAFLPQFIDATRGSVGLQMLILGTLVPLTAIPADLITALTGGTVAQKMAENQTLKRLLNWLGAAFLLYLGLRIFTEQ